MSGRELSRPWFRSLPPFRFTLARAMTIVLVLAIGCCVMTIVIEHAAEHHASAEWLHCGTSLHELTLTVLAYESANGVFPPGTLPSKTLPPTRRVSWVPLILPWTDSFQNGIYLFEQDLPWDAPENCLPLMRVTDADTPARVVRSPSPAELPRRLTCSANHSTVTRGLPDPMHYVGVAGVGTDAPFLAIGHPRAGIFGYDRQTRMADIKDGATNTMMLAETTSANGPWTAGGPATVRGVDPGRRPYIGSGRQFGGSHRGGAVVAFADGSVRFLNDTMDPNIFEALTTIAGAEALP